MFEVLRRLPRPVKAFLLRLAEGMGAQPQRIRAGPARGMTLMAPLSRWRQYGGGTHEAHVAHALWELLGPGMVACDGGAHLGYLTLVMARRVGSSGRVFSFEPIPEHADSLRRTMARNRLSQVTVMEQALGADCGPAWLEEGLTDAMARVVADAAPGRGRRHAVAATTLDAWEAELGGLERLDLIKLDVEGQELEALEGGAGVLRRHRPALVCEVHWSRQIGYHPQQLVGWLADAGYAAKLIRRPDQPGATLEHLLAQTAGTPPPPHIAAFHILATAAGSRGSRFR